MCMHGKKLTDHTQFFGNQLHTSTSPIQENIQAIHDHRCPTEIILHEIIRVPRHHGNRAKEVQRK